MDTRNIVIIDDNESYNKLLKTTLEKEGFCVTSFSDSEIAMREIPLKKYDLIISDYMMPKYTGKDLAESLQDLNTPIWILSAGSDPECIKKSYQSGAVRYKFKDESIYNLIEDVFLLFNNKNKRTDNKDSVFFTAYTPQFSNSSFKLNVHDDFITLETEDEIPKGSLVEIQATNHDELKLLKIDHIEFNDDCTFTHICSEITRSL